MDLYLCIRVNHERTVCILQMPNAIAQSRQTVRCLQGRISLEVALWVHFYIDIALVFLDYIELMIPNNFLKCRLICGFLILFKLSRRTSNMPSRQLNVIRIKLITKRLINKLQVSLSTLFKYHIQLMYLNLLVHHIIIGKYMFSSHIHKLDM